jgi:nucleoside-diphosphate-sugar epimerase
MGQKESTKQVESFPVHTKRAFVTGGSGYIGHHVVKQLANSGWKVAVLTRPSTDISNLADLDIDFFQDDCTNGYLDFAISRFMPDVVFHLAAVFDDESPDGIQRMIDANLRLGIQLLASMQKNDCKHLVNTGTFSSYSSNGDTHPLSLYAAMKLAMEQVIDYHSLSSGLHAVTLNLCDVYGPSDPRPKLLNLIKDAISTGRSLSLTPGYQLMNLLHVNDVSAAFLTAAEGILNFANGEHAKHSVASADQISVRDLVQKIQDISGDIVPVVFGGKPYRETDIMFPWHGNRLPDWEPKIDLATGLKKFLSMKTD